MQNHYERVLPGRSRGKEALFRALFVLLYLVFAALLVWLCLSLGALTYLFFLLPLGVGLLVFLTLPFWKKQYEYSFYGEMLTVSRIFGGKRRKVLIELDLRKVSAIFRFEEANRARAEAFGARRSLYAVPDLGADDLYLILFGEGKEKGILCLALDERSLSIIGFYNRAALTK